ncbi:hypothetical protein [Proteiniclasticum sp.]|uniref:hypothetical protein n=1 Tax=Proteiniclasticum sp. TaxID=2053595 RepID=UPI0028A0EDE7|nr:hypothetical protein [Proteiniclasticum sp.]
METKYIIGLLVGLLIYVGAVSGLYLVYKPNIDYQRERRRKLKEDRRKALEMAAEAKKFQRENTEKDPDSKETDHK